MEAAAHTPGGYGGVSQKVGREFVGKDRADAGWSESDGFDMGEEGYSEKEVVRELERAGVSPKEYDAVMRGFERHQRLSSRRSKKDSAKDCTMADIAKMCDALNERMDAIENRKADAAWAKKDAEALSPEAAKWFGDQCARAIKEAKGATIPKEAVEALKEVAAKKFPK